MISQGDKVTATLARRGISVALACALTLAGCREEPITWRAPLHDVVFLNDTLEWSNLVPDTLWTEGADGLMLHATVRRPLLGSAEWLPSLDTSWTTNFTLPFIGGPIPVAPGAEIWAEEEVVNLDLPDVDLRRVRLGGGALSLSVSSTVAGPLELRYQIQGAAFPAGTNGGSNAFTVLVEEGQAGTLTVPLDGVEIDLDGPAGLDANRLVTSWQVGVPAAAPMEVGLFGSDELNLQVAFTGLQLAQVEGRFGERTLAISDTLEVAAAGQLDALQVNWTGLEAELLFRNTTGLDYQVGIEGLGRIDSGVFSSLSDAVLGSTIFLSRATVVEGQGMADWSILPTAADFNLGSGSSDLSGFLSTLPEAFTISGAADINPLGDVSGGFDRIDFGYLPELELTVKGPLQVGPSGARWVDTIRPELPGGIGFDGDLLLTVRNGLPVELALEMQLVDLPQQFLLLQSQGLPLSNFAPVVIAAGSGAPDQPVTSEVVIPLEGIQFDALRMGAGLRVVADFLTLEPVAQFDAAQRVVVLGHLQGDAIISIE